MKIRFCEHNRGKGKAYRLLKEEYPDISIKIKNCIKKCGSCDGKPMATIDKKKITGKNSDELYQNLKSYIDKKQ